MTDIRISVSEYGLSLLGISLAGIIIYMLRLVYHLIFNELGYWAISLSGRTILFVICLVVASLIFPVRRYGMLTDSKKGAAFLLFPASVLEKFLSAVIICTLIVPMAFSVIYAGTDWLWTLFDRTSDGTIISVVCKSFFVTTVNAGDENVSFIAYDDLVNFILIFMLGALIFKRGKIVKTFLAISAFSMALLFLFWGMFAKTLAADGELQREIITHVFWLDLFNDTVLNLILLAGIYFRMKRIQH